MVQLKVVLVEPSNPGNLGAIARVMANFGASELVLVNPKCDKDDIEGLVRSKHAYKILKNAKIVSSISDVGADYIAGTTSLMGTDYNIQRSPLSPEAFAKKLSKFSKKVAVVFGREGDGLYNNEIDACDFVVTIPTSLKYRAMNLSHSVAVVLYEIFKQSPEKKTGEHIACASEKEKKILLSKINDILDELKFRTAEKKQTQKLVWKRAIGKAMLTKREIFALIGFFKKLKD
ncbi:RNA methyltransferase [Candidatus Woesearchaeota archaeon]|nr:RNA methyltransferase [Candidatus Woesearchaeota archaeon]MBW3017183.1 RNA methyltransferase [Candidatus Woesearchaeota archaeon]